MSGFTDFFGRLSVSIKTSQFQRALTGLSDQQLGEIGLKRRDISRRARELAQNH
jgi:hypothetical protein